MGKFPDVLKNVEVTPVYKKVEVNDKQNYRPVNYPIYQKYLKNVFTLKLIYIFSKYLT